MSRLPDRRFIGIGVGILTLIKDVLTNPSKGDIFCKKCERWLFDEDFARDKSRPTGRFPQCKDCKALYQRLRWESIHPAKKKEHQQKHKEYKESHKHKIRKANLKYWHHKDAIQKAKRRGDIYREPPNV